MRGKETKNKDLALKEENMLENLLEFTKRSLAADMSRVVVMMLKCKLICAKKLNLAKLRSPNKLEFKR